MTVDVEVVVVRAGPAGLMLAGDLARAGVGCTVFERRAGRSSLTRAFAVHARALEQLDARGVADQLVASGIPVPELRFFAGAALDLSRLPSRFPYPLVTPQYETERVLEERAGPLGADIRYGTEVTGLTQHTYHAERHPVGRKVLRGSGALLRIGLTGPPALVAARNLLATAATRTPVVADRLAGAISGISICYPAPRGAHPLTGKRVADLPLAGGGRLYQALRDGRFLLAASRGALPADVAAGYGDRVEAVTVERSSGAVVLIRPDAYIAWAAGRAGGLSIPDVRGALARWCGNPGRPAPQAVRR